MIPQKHLGNILDQEYFVADDDDEPEDGWRYIQYVSATLRLGAP